MIESTELTSKDLRFYKYYKSQKYQEIIKKFNINHKRNFDIYDVVKIKKHVPNGYAGQYGIVIDIYPDISVIAYDTQAKWYWISDFRERDLIKTNKSMKAMGELYEKTKEFLLINKFNISTDDFKKAWEEYKNTIYKVRGKIIYVDFKKK